MENGPFIDGLPIKNGDFPWLCSITRWYIQIHAVLGWKQIHQQTTEKIGAWGRRVLLIAQGGCIGEVTHCHLALCTLRPFLEVGTHPLVGPEISDRIGKSTFQTEFRKVTHGWNMVKKREKIQEQHETTTWHGWGNHRTCRCAHLKLLSISLWSSYPRYVAFPRVPWHRLAPNVTTSTICHKPFVMRRVLKTTFCNWE